MHGCRRLKPLVCYMTLLRDSEYWRGHVRPQRQGSILALCLCGHREGSRFNCCRSPTGSSITHELTSGGGMINEARQHVFVLHLIVFVLGVESKPRSLPNACNLTPADVSFLLFVFTSSLPVSLPQPLFGRVSLGPEAALQLAEATDTISSQEHVPLLNFGTFEYQAKPSSASARIVIRTRPSYE